MAVISRRYSHRGYLVSHFGRVQSALQSATLKRGCLFQWDCVPVLIALLIMQPLLGLPFEEETLKGRAPRPQTTIVVHAP